MNPWEILGIEETSDRKAIKKAYTSLIKRFRPEDNAEEFRRIREAYEHALVQATYLDLDDDIDIESHYNTHSPENSPANHVEIPVIVSPDPCETMLEIVQKLISGGEPYVNRPEEWEVIFNNDLLIHIETRRRFSFSLFMLLADHLADKEKYFWLPREVWFCINKHLNWSSMEMELYRRFYNDSYVDLVLNRIRWACGEKTTADLEESTSRYTQANVPTGNKPFQGSSLLAYVAVFMLLRFFCNAMTGCDSSDTYYHYGRVEQTPAITWPQGKKGDPQYIGIDDHFQKFLDEKTSAERNYFKIPSKDSLNINQQQ